MSLELNLNRRTIITAAGDYKNFDISSVSSTQIIPKRPLFYTHHSEIFHIMITQSVSQVLFQTEAFANNMLRLKGLEATTLEDYVCHRSKFSPFCTFQKW